MTTTTGAPPSAYPADVEAIVRGRHGNPFVVLGMQGGDGKPLAVNTFSPQAGEVEVLDAATGEVVAALSRIHPEGFFSGFIEGRHQRFRYRLRLRAGEFEWELEDPYAFPPILGELDEYLLGEGRHLDQYEQLGAHPRTVDGVDGVVFAVWAPNARRVSVVGDFNAWDGRRHPMRKRIGVGVWELFVPQLERGATYKYEILGLHGERLPLKADPVSFYQELAPATASIVHGLPQPQWNDGEWMAGREARQGLSAPVSIYELHLGSWRTNEDGTPLHYAAIADQLVDYLTALNFTHVELMPVTEHPFTGSWGYQPIGLFAPTSRFGAPEDFAGFVDRLHAAGIGVIMDWVPAHFPSDAHGLARFDGTALYEHEDPRLGFHRDWNTLIYNFGRNEVANYLLANALFWLDVYHIDALRVDAVASMLYLDYSREPGEWIPNRHGGNENLEAIDFLRETNRLVFGRHPGAQTMAEESTAWPQVSRPIEMGGLGFGYKWNMGWMHDTLTYMSKDPIHRRHHHGQMTFGIHYGFSENFVLPLSHDEVVHGKGSMLGKMPGDTWQKFANLRAYYAFMWTHPGKKLLFMGGEFGQQREWNHDSALDWHLLEDPMHKGLQTLVGDLNRVYRDCPALHQLDCDPAGFEWIEAGDAENSIFLFLRKGREEAPPIVVACNMTPMVRQDYRVGVPHGGRWREILNTDSEIYGGSNVGNGGYLNALDEESHGRAASLRLTLPPLGAVILAPDGA
ncbi:1,4-alpha-glucan branching protein GlgB [Devosia nitrariae]|uniref:1,4-alpha-glucan branching enzyme GlgB n=1 Tax=Devosia nitrariae TaxID=2071872 RepID=A0ABQ5W6P5_9HYPH|nr:1,4-alpha-glucan branching protein GlgB [Devosia nitrariae]GLQ55563.1 1,4-alpha-glucan branching enzyme GlgB [Devosia nitrariae]